MKRELQNGNANETPDATEQHAVVTRGNQPKINPTNGHQHQLSDPLILPSPNTPHASAYPDFPLPPSQQATPEWPHGERDLHSSPLNADQDKPDGILGTDNIQHASQGDQNFDLKPPPPNSKVKHVDTLSERLFSGEHLRVILQDPTFFLRFTAFLNRYRAQSAPVLVRYLEAQKALKAVEYANALAETMKSSTGEQQGLAASIDPTFEANLNRNFDTLVDDALPAYITTCLTRVVTESMVREITGQGMPVMRELVGGLAEVFCLADPSIKDCPIVYASEEFYRTTRYSRDDVLGRNCRFLQGPKTNRKTIARIKSAVKAGQESCETVLNYKRDGTPFMNLLLTAPLYDNRGSVRYFIGAQVDVSGLIEDGRGLDSFERVLTESRRHRESDLSDDAFPQKHLKTLNEFGQMLSLDEASAFQSHSRPSSMADSSISYKDRQTPTRRDTTNARFPRRVLGNDDAEDQQDPFKSSSTQLSSSSSSLLSSGGKLPGVYQNYLLVRPHPSLRIIFVSPALRIPGLLQSPFLSRIGGPPHVRDGLADAFEQGAAVTAKVTWLPTSSKNDNGNNNSEDADRPSTSSSRKGPLAPPSSSSSSDPPPPRTRYISCTPLLGSDDRVGVWMVVMVENELVTGSLASRQRALGRYHGYDYSDVPVPVPVMAAGSEFERESGYRRSGMRRAGDKGGSEGGRLYAEFMRGSSANHGDGGKVNGQLDKAQGRREDANGTGTGHGDGEEEDPFAVDGEGRIEELAPTPGVEKAQPLMQMQ